MQPLKVTTQKQLFGKNNLGVACVEILKGARSKSGQVNKLERFTFFEKLGSLRVKHFEN